MATSLPVRLLANSLPVASTAAAPVRTRCSTPAGRVQLTDECSVSIPESGESASTAWSPPSSST